MSTGPEGTAWQPVVAALANDRLRRVYAARVLGTQEASDKPATEQEIRRLVAVGLLTAEGTVADGAFAALLAANATPRPEGVDKYFSQGMLVQLPASPGSRAEVLKHLARRLIPAETMLTEVEINRLLATVTGDVPTLRRALVDHGLLERTPDGSSYVRPSDQDRSPGVA
ncbi:DUF2087 domain-containing protein [Specibacter cremeus]|uniref:DUF2087 domain-containing protein n=1 Tax=Specibacter cremeus TaxID=1629051 RepID=UPI000F7B6160|nr:DUF2087 domain-containing protein [Specibacter cremeus]